MLFGDRILDYKDELLSDLNTLLGFESVASLKPDECKKALEFILKRAEDFDLAGEQVTDKSGIGESNAYLPDVSENFSANALFPCFTVGHNTLRGRDDSNAKTVKHLGDIVLTCINTQTGL